MSDILRLVDEYSFLLVYSAILAVTVLIVGLVARRVYKWKGRAPAVLSFIILAPITFFFILWAYILVAIWIAISTGKFSP
jgi:cation transporter-like permease